MSDLEAIWKSKADETILDAGKNLDSYSPEAIQVILSEHCRRNLPVPAITQSDQIPSKPATSQVVINGIEIPFRKMAGLIFKWSLATIPTILFWYIIVGFISKLK